MNLLPFKRLITDKCGVAFKDDLFAQLSKAIESRMAYTAIRNFSGYLDTLLHNDAEFQSLLSLLTVNETYFMREPHHYDLLANRLVPELLGKRHAEGREIQILSAGCSTGEEPYSILISLVHKHGEKILDLVSVVAFDIHPGAIETAKKGIYGEHSFRGIDADIKSRYFTPLVNDQYEVLPLLKQKVRFYLKPGQKGLSRLYSGRGYYFLSKCFNLFPARYAKKHFQQTGEYFERRRLSHHQYGRNLHAQHGDSFSGGDEWLVFIQQAV